MAGNLHLGAPPCSDPSLGPRMPTPPVWSSFLHTKDFWSTASWTCNRAVFPAPQGSATALASKTWQKGGVMFWVQHLRGQFPSACVCVWGGGGVEACVSTREKG